MNQSAGAGAGHTRRFSADEKTEFTVATAAASRRVCGVSDEVFVGLFLYLSRGLDTINMVLDHSQSKSSLHQQVYPLQFNLYCGFALVLRACCYLCWVPRHMRGTGLSDMKLGRCDRYVGPWRTGVHTGP
ncbi:unnamed protein product [Boreogadus saida]